MTVQEYRDQILDYLRHEEEYSKDDIRNNESLPEDQQVEIGLLIKDCTISEKKGNDYLLSVTENNSKLRPGDLVVLSPDNKKTKYRASVIENGINKIFINCENELDVTITYNIKVLESVMLGNLIRLISKIDDGAPGAHFLKILAAIDDPSPAGIGKLRQGALSIPKNMNEAQCSACLSCFNRPSIYCIQGPPGTGKTDVLATIAFAFSCEGKDVLVLSNTHQAVNNALNKVASVNTSAAIIKIGKSIRAEGLLPSVSICETFSEYLSDRQSKSRKATTRGDVIGMTLQASFVNMGLRQTGVQPSIILVDEAGQTPLVQAAAIGSFGSGSVVFIGDDRQMPPIYHEKLQTHPLSVSIFEHLTTLYPSFKTVLNVTYRMNSELTVFVSKSFYEPYGIELIASEFSKDRKLHLNSNCSDKRVSDVLSADGSIQIINVTTDDYCTDYNIEEAMFTSSLIEEAINLGMSVNDIAVITPFRRQVKAIRECCLQRLVDIPLIDTVERLQGQDVDLIIMSMTVSDASYYNQCSSFLHNENRLNVMVSRAKKKVVVLKSNTIKRLFLHKIG